MSQTTLGSGPYRNSNLFSGYYLDERISDLDAWDCNEEAAEAFEKLRELWRKEAPLLDSYNEDELIDAWIGEVFDILGFDAIAEAALPNGGGHVDRLLYENEDARRAAAERKITDGVDGMFAQASAILEAKQWDADFEQRFSEVRSYRDASHQIKYYLERTPSDLKWGVLTDGKKWRLYGTKDYETQTYYEVDLPEILESGDLNAFKYFYVFFRPDAFVEHAGSSFLDDVWTESETAAQELGEDLQDNVFRALRVLGRGFVESNGLEIDPDDKEARDELKEQSLVLLYRLMFILYAESRGLIDPDDHEASEEYQEYFSLDATRENILNDVEGMEAESGEVFAEKYSKFSSSIWTRLSELFDLIDKGEEELDIPPYNGGLFDAEAHSFLADHEVKDPYIAEVIYWLSTTENEKGEHVPADYADLDTRHLGSIYEGLLEHEFRIADSEGIAAVSEDGGQVWKPATKVSAAEAVEIVEQGGLYVVNDEGERKATGAYYTPDYVVSYIVEETVDPLIDEIDEDLQAQNLDPGDREYFVEFWQRVKKLTLLDPAMGSGHFLTKATGYLTEQVMAVVREQEIQSYDEQYIRREISKECIYGVDLNGMAVELAKLSMWLETLAADQPLAFLDHHLKTGNSLVGSDITEVLSNGGGDGEDGQLTLTQAFARVRQDTLEHVMELMADLLAYDNETLEDVKSMEELYEEIRADPLYQRLFELANVHTAEQFGLDVPDDAYEEMAGAIENEEDWAEIESKDWFVSAQVTAEEEDFFHWELEYPEVFFDEVGERMAEAGYDAVIGNPPYVRQEQLRNVKSYLKSAYRSYDSSADLYTYFIESGYNLQKDGSSLGYIVSNKFLHAQYGIDLRSLISQNTRIRQAIDFNSLSVFGDDVSAYPLILIFEKGAIKSDSEVLLSRLDSLEFSDINNVLKSSSYSVPQSKFIGSGWRIQSPKVTNTLETITSGTDNLVDYLDVSLRRGLLTGLNEAFIIGSTRYSGLDTELEHIYPLLKGKDIDQYHTKYVNRYIIAIPSGWSKRKSGTDTEVDAWQWFKKKYPNVSDHLVQFKDAAKNRHDRGDCWWELRPCDYYDDLLKEKILYPVISKGPSFTMDLNGFFINDKLYSIPKKDYTLLAILNSSLVEFWVQAELSGLRGGYQEFRAVHVEQIPITKQLEVDNKLDTLAKEAIEYRSTLSNLNLSVMDHLGTHTGTTTLPEIGFVQPSSDSAESALQETTKDKSNLRAGDIIVKRDSKSTVTLHITARYKPDDDAHETDQWGYTETEYLPAFRITDLTETEANLIESFVPVAVDEAGGFANFRETATKTNSLIDRLKAIELPNVNDVEDGLENYLKTKARAEELDEKIKKTDQLIDEIVYELYELTDEEIEIVEDAVAE